MSERRMAKRSSVGAGHLLAPLTGAGEEEDDVRSIVHEILAIDKNK